MTSPGIPPPGEAGSSRELPGAVVLGLSDPGLGAIRALGRRGVRVVGLDWRDDAPGRWSRYCEARRCPHPERDPEGMLRALREAAALAGPRPAVVPSADEFYDFLVAHRAALEGELRLAIPPPGAAEALLDKRSQYELAERLGVPYPRTFYPASREEAEAAASALRYPALIKPLQGHVWRERRADTATAKGLEVHAPAELVARLGEVRAAGLAVLVQEVIPGPITSHLEVCALLRRSDGSPIATFTARKLRQFPPKFGVGTLVESTDDPEAAALAVSFLRAAGFRGLANVELKRDARDGRILLIEVNPRIHLQSALPADCGMDLTWLHHLDLCGRNPAPVTGFRGGVRWLNLRADLRSFAALRAAGELTPRAWISSWVGARSFAAFAADDPLPFAYVYGSRLCQSAGRRRP